jgi:hypothetical protein
MGSINVSSRRSEAHAAEPAIVIHLVIYPLRGMDTSHPQFLEDIILSSQQPVK